MKEQAHDVLGHRLLFACPGDLSNGEPVKRDEINATGGTSSIGAIAIRISDTTAAGGCL